MLSAGCKVAGAAMAAVANPSGTRMMSSGGRKLVTLIPGDGIGPEIAASVQKNFRRC